MRIHIVVAIVFHVAVFAWLAGCSDQPGGVTPPKYHTEENAGIWTDMVDSHVPLVTRLDASRIEVRVTFSPTLKPLHYVESIVLMTGENTVVAQRRFNPSVSIPTVVFTLPDPDVSYWVIAKCNLHDMWRAEVK